MSKDKTVSEYEEAEAHEILRHNIAGILGAVSTIDSFANKVCGHVNELIGDEAVDYKDSDDEKQADPDGLYGDLTKAVSRLRENVSYLEHQVERLTSGT